MNMFVAALAAYLLGSLSFAVLVSHTLGLADPRTYGSKNPGATNVLRSGNKLAAVLTLLGDAFKGWLAVFLVQRFGPDWGLGHHADAVVGLCAFIGHVWPVFFRFAGGKGVATAAGVMLAWDPLLGGAVLLTWLAVAYFSRYSSLAALLAALAAPMYYAALYGPDATLLSLTLMSALLIYRHRQNIVNLMHGKESRIGQKKSG